MRPNRPALALALAAFVVAAESRGVAAQEDLDIEDVQLDELLERDLDERLGTTTAVSRKTEDVLSAPATISTLSWEEIRLSGARTVPDLLRFVPGVQVYRNAPGNYIVSMRGAGGLNGNNVVVTVNGVPINSPLDASVDWDLVPAHVLDIERIEVVRGPVSTIYGQNAYTGVINIVTRQAYGRSSSIAARGEAGIDRDLGALGGLSGRYAHNGSATRASIVATGELDASGQTAAGASSPDLLRGGTSAHLELLTTAHSNLRFDLAASRSGRSSLDHLVLESVPQTRSLVLGSLRYAVHGIASPIERVEVWARNISHFTETDPDEYSGFSYADTQSTRMALGTDIGVRFAPNAGLTLGAEADLDWVDAPYVNDTANDQFYPGFGTYGTFNYSPVEPLNLTIGARADVPTALDHFEMSYRAGAIYHATDWSVRLAAASAYRTPSYVELGGRFVDPASGLILLEGEPDLRSPTNETLELGLIVSPIPTLHVAPTVYLSRLRDVIVEDFEPLVRRTFTNDSSPRDLFGTELEVDWSLRDDLAIALNVGTLHWLSVDDEVSATIGVPEQSATVTGGARLHGTLLHERFGYGLGANYVSERSFAVRAGVPPRIIDEDVAAQTHAFVMAEYFLGMSLPLWASIRLQAALPDDTVESPLPAASTSAQTVMFGLSYREE
jgi:iron complex outermembrane receptor protein